MRIQLSKALQTLTRGELSFNDSSPRLTSCLRAGCDVASFKFNTRVDFVSPRACMREVPAWEPCGKFALGLFFSGRSSVVANLPQQIFSSIPVSNSNACHRSLDFASLGSTSLPNIRSKRPENLSSRRACGRSAKLEQSLNKRVVVLNDHR